MRPSPTGEKSKLCVTRGGDSLSGSFLISNLTNIFMRNAMSHGVILQPTNYCMLWSVSLDRLC